MSNNYRPQDELTLSRGEGWAGTYALTLRFMLDDLLSDGASIGVRIEAGELYPSDDPELAEALESAGPSYVHPVCNVTEDFIHTEDAWAIPLEAVTSVTVV